MSFFKSWFSIEEQKVSALIIAFLIVVGISLYAYMKRGDISENLLVLAQTLIYAITGINMATSVGDVIKNRMNVHSVEEDEEHKI